MKHDLPSVYGIRSIADIEKYIGYLESANLIYISPLVNVGTKQLLKAQDKIYIADAAVRNAVFMRNDITNDPKELGIIAETAVYKHIKSFCYNEATQIGCYRGCRKEN